jgi:hypothetical protein
LSLSLERRRIAHPRLRTTRVSKVGLHQGFTPGEMGFNINLRSKNPEQSLSGRHSGTPIYVARLAAVALITQGGERRPPSAIGLGPLEEHD